jgi:hypothetical protein
MYRSFRPDPLTDISAIGISCLYELLLHVLNFVPMTAPLSIMSITRIGFKYL